MDAAGVQHCILVPTSAEGDRNDTSFAAAAAHPDRFAVVGRIDLQDPSQRDGLAGWMELPHAAGLRVTFRRGASANWLDDGTADWFWGEAERLGIPLYVHVPGLLSRVPRIAAAHPDLWMTIDHMGLTATVKEHDIDPIIDELVPLARYPNISVKASSLPSVVSDGYPYRSMFPRIERIVTAYGRERVFWGSDITRLPCSMRDHVRMFTEELDFLSEEDLVWIMGRGLHEWFDLGRFFPATGGERVQDPDAPAPA
jgi:predicted TIM-barrel fold metal-dependent hydrolase